jgi:lipid II:glycine glycyltransferase (peptidoglycan interpeptide bridge formation enzyme)
VPCAPELSNLMAFHWAGFDLRLGYTHRFENLASEELLWKGMRDKTRNLCRKAEKLTVINRTPTVASFIAVLEKTFKRQDIDISSSFPLFERMDEVMARRQQRAIYSAEDAQGRVHAAVYVVFDDRHTFYLAGGGDPALRDSGAHALAMWHAIKDSGARSKVFDFEGSMVPTIEHFVRGFGPRLVPRYTAEKETRALRLYRAMKPK